MQPQRSLGGTVATIATLGLAAGAVWAIFDMRSELAELRRETTGTHERLDAIESTLHLTRMEQQAQSGLGFAALLERLEYWAPKLGVATTPQAELPSIQEKVQAILDAFPATGSDAFAKLVAAFRDAERGPDDELQMWLLRAMEKVDAARAEDVYKDVLRGLEFKVSPRMRLFAADKLIEINPTAAGDVLQRVLMTESYRGLDPQRVEQALLEKYPSAAEYIVHYNGFWSFVQKYALTEHPETEPVLLMVLGRRHQHDMMTLQECVKTLGQLGSANA